VEELEDRQVLSGVQPSAVEQLFLEKLNDARANPAAYGAALGVNLSAVPPAQPLAFNPLLIEAARRHAQDMNARRYFAHKTPEGLDAGQRMLAVGFVWNAWGESLAGGTAYPGPDDALRALILDAGVPDLGHRRHLLALDALFQGQNQVGIGIVQGGSGPLVDYYTIDTAGTWSNRVFLTGVVFTDTNHNGKYDIGEGLSGVTVRAAGAGAVRTWISGGYSIAVDPGTYVVTASGAGLPAPITRTVTVGLSNVRLNFAPGQDAYLRKLYRTILGRGATDAELGPWLAIMQGPWGVLGVVEGIERSGEARTRLVKHWYVTYLGRQAINGEEQAWVSWMLRGATEEQVVAGILSSVEFRNRIRARAAAPAYIRTLYALLLHRLARPAELATWLAKLARARPYAIVLSLLRSREYREGVVRSYYRGLLHRRIPTSLAEIDLWARSAVALTDIRAGFEASPEFFLHR
jgi:uncharacterized protein YkwD